MSGKTHFTKRCFAFLLSLTMVLSMFGSAGFVSIAENEPVDGIHDTWTVSNASQANEVTELREEAGTQWRYFASGEGNDNGSNPAIFLNDTAEPFEEGTVTFTIKPLTAASDTRAGVYLRYESLSHNVFVGYDSGGWFYQLYNGQDNPWYQGSRIAAPEANQEANVVIAIEGNSMNVTVNGENAFGGAVDISSIAGAGKFGVKAASFGSAHSQILMKGITYPGQKAPTPVEKVELNGTVKDAENAPIAGAQVKLGTKTVETNEAGEFQFMVTKEDQTLTVSKAGYQNKTVVATYTEGEPFTVDVVLEAELPTETNEIRSDEMTVELDQAFPRVIRYELADGKTMDGQPKKLTQMTINGKNVEPTVEFKKVDQKTAEYTLTTTTVPTDGATLKLRVTVKGTELKMEFTDIKNHKENPETDEDIVRTIAFPEHSLVSINSKQEGANVAGGNVSTVTTRSGDDFFDLKDSTSVGSFAYWMAMISNNELSATLYSNSEASVGRDWTYTGLDVYEYEGAKYAGLRSQTWTYQRGLNYRVENENELSDLKADKVEGLEDVVGMNPYVKIKIVGDVNKDGKVDWNDGAIAQRDIQRNRYGAEMVPDTVAIRIAMNFGSHAQNPFLTTLDNVKKVALHTEGLGQNVLLKGYGSEGHDSGHLNYADVGRRIGGPEDMKILMAEGKKYGAYFGIHVNASETYPESKYFDEGRLLRSGKTYSYGWNWIDQGININADYDMRHGRAQRFKDLADVLAKEDGSNDLAYLYVDVWGNGQSGDNSTWPSRMLAKEILAQGWAVAGEWSHAFGHDAILQHWAADVVYGGYQNKGINSQIIRFVQNHQRDSWGSNHLAYSGQDLVPLLGGYKMRDFEGWQGRNDYNAYIVNLFQYNLPTKFLQHYLVTELERGESTRVPNPNGGTISWTPEMRVKLSNGQDEVEVTRGSNDYENHRDEYLTRVMTVNGKKVLEENGNNISYLIPWNWDANGNALTGNDQKLYFFTTTSGAKTYSIPADWDVENVKVYKLTDTGKKDLKTVAVVDGQITLDLDTNQPYIVYKEEKANKDVSYGYGAHIVDPSFNGRNLDAWTIEGNDEANITRVEDTAASNPVLKITDNTEDTYLTQELTGLKPGKRYVAYVGVENDSDTKASISIKVDGKEVASNYTMRSLAMNYVKAYAHNRNDLSYTRLENGQRVSYFQNMFVWFEAPASGKVTLTLGKEAGAGTTYFDDIRVTENLQNNWESDKKFVQDFEEVPQGIYPFVVSNIEGVEDNRTHLSERHEPYTQKGWHTKRVSDVIGGTWSVKTNGLIRRNRMVYHTIPQNFRFENGKTYTVSFDYLAGTSGAYQFVVFDGAWEKNPRIVERIDLASSVDNPADDEANRMSYTFTVDGDNYQVGIYSANVPTDTHGFAGKEVNFAGFADFILDNLAIELREGEIEEVDKTALEEAIAEAESFSSDDYTEKTYGVLRKALADGDIVLKDVAATKEQVAEAANAIYEAIAKLEKKVVDDNKAAIAEVVADSEQLGAGDSEGPIRLAFDGNTNTIWHTSWNGITLPTTVTITFEKQETLKTFRHLPRQGGGTNGIITGYKLETSNDGEEWTEVNQGTWPNNKEWKEADLKETKAKYLRLTVTDAVSQEQGKAFASAAEFEVIVIPELDPTKVEKDELIDTIKKANAMPEKGFAEEETKAFKAALAAANETLANEEATQEEVDKANADLLAAMLALFDAVVPVGPDEPDEPDQPDQVDKTDLNQAIKTAQGIDLTGKTQESSQALLNELAKAKLIQKDEEATQAQVDAAVKALIAAMDGLKDVEEPVEPTKEGFVEEDGNTYFYENGDTVKGEWRHFGDRSYYFRAVTGTMVKGWQYIDGHWRFFRDSGTMVKSRWEWLGKQWKFFNSKGESMDQFRVENGKVWLSQAGPNTKYCKGWKTINGLRYFFRKTSGTRVEGWQYIDGYWRFFRKGSGTQAFGWQFIDGHWYFLRDNTGTRVTGRQYIDGKWYQFRGDGTLSGIR